MKDKGKTKEQLVKELAALRQRVAGLEVLRNERLRQYLDLLLTHSPDHVYLYTREGAWSYVSPAAAQALGLPQEDCIGKTWRELNMPAAIMEPVEAKIRGIFSSGETLSGNIVYPTVEGERHYDFRMTPVYGDDGSINLILGIVRDITERRVMEKDIIASKDQFYKIFRSTPCLIAIITVADGRILDINGGVTDILGYSREEAIGKTTIEMKLWANSDDRSRMLKMMQEQGSVRNLEVEIRTKSGEARTGLFAAELITFKGELCTLSIVQDITERKRLGKALRESKEKLYNLVAQSPDGIVFIDERGGIIEWNQSVEQITGLKYAEVLGKPIWDMVYQVVYREHKNPRLYAQLKTRLLTLLRTGQHPRLHRFIERTIQHPDGTCRHVQLLVYPIKTDQGFMFGGICRDITEPKQAEEALKESEQKYRALVENSLTGIFVLQDDKYVYVNDRFAQMHGYQPEELLGVENLKLVHPDEREMARETIARRMRGDPITRPIVRRRLKKDGQTIWVELIAATIDYRGKPAAMGNMMNISDHKKIEEELRTLLETRSPE